jgi:hypothetical protein
MVTSKLWNINIKQYKLLERDKKLCGISSKYTYYMKLSQFLDENIQCELFITLFILLMNVVLKPA